MNIPCMNESPRTMPRSGASGSGSGPRRPQELVVCREVSTGIAAVPGLRRRARALGHEEEHQEAALERHVPQPDRSRVGPEPIGPARVVGLEDRRGEQQRAIEIAPAQQPVCRIVAGVRIRRLVGGVGLGVDADLAPRCDSAIPCERYRRHCLIDLGSGRGQTDRVRTAWRAAPPGAATR